MRQKLGVGEPRLGKTTSIIVELLFPFLGAVWFIIWVFINRSPIEIMIQIGFVVYVSSRFGIE